MRVIYCLGIGMLLMGIIVLAAQSECTLTYPTPKLIGMIRSGAGNQDLVVKDETAFILTGRISPDGGVIGVLRAIDVSNPSSPQEIGSRDLITTGNPNKMALKENYLYIVSSYLEIFDISIPESPQPVGTLALNVQAVSIGIKDNAVYVYEDRNERVLVIDVSDPANPSYVRSVQMTFIVHQIYTHGNLALLANAGLGLSVLDVTTPLDPIFLSTFRLPDGGVGDVTAKGQYAFFPRWAGPSETFNEFFVVDISNPSQMELTASIEIGKPLTGAWSIALEGTLTVVVFQKYPSGYITLVDISDPTSPQERGRADIPEELGNAQGGVVMQNSLIYVSASEGLAIYEIIYR